MGGGAEQQPAAWAQHAARFRKPAARVMHVLDHLPRPDRVEARISQRPLPIDVDEAQIELWVAFARPSQRLLCDVDPDDGKSGLGQLVREPSFAAAKVKYAFASLQMANQEGETRQAVRRLRPLRHLLPQVIEVLAHRRSLQVLRRPGARARLCRYCIQSC